MKSLLKAVFVLALFGAGGRANAATSIIQPGGGECVKGGTFAPVLWSNNDAGYAHAYLSYDNGSGHPMYPSTAAGYIAHPAVSGQNATIPSVTASGYRVYVEAHDSGHAVTSTALSAPFDIDSTGPGAFVGGVSSKTSTSVTLSWNYSDAVNGDTGCMGWEGFRIFQNGSQIATNVLIGVYTVNNLSPGMSYNFVVQAYDTFHTTDSNTIPVTTDAAPPPTPAPAPPSGGSAPPSGGGTSPTPTDPANAGTTNTSDPVDTPVTGTSGIPTAPTQDKAKTTLKPGKSAAELAAIGVMEQPWWVLAAGLTLAGVVLGVGKYLAARAKPPEPAIPPPLIQDDATEPTELKL